MKTIGIILLVLMGICFYIFAIATYRVLTGRTKYVPMDKKSLRQEIRESTSAILRNERTGKKTVIRRRTLWEKLIRRD